MNEAVKLINVEVAALDYHSHIKLINELYPNKKKSDYESHKAAKLSNRLLIAETSAIELRKHFTDRQSPGYRHKEAGRPLQLPTHAENNALELLADYILAEDHTRGLKISRSPNEVAAKSEEYPELGAGAMEYLERCYIGVPITIGERRKVKTCEICDSEFIDRSRAFNSKVCGDSCRTIKEAKRKRKEYNENVHDLEDEQRLKRYRERQDLAYPFYSPQEMSEFMRRGEYAVGGYEELSRKAMKAQSNGKRKPMYIGRDEFDADRPFNYHPRGRNKPELKSYEHLAGEVIKYKLSDEEFAAFKEMLSKSFVPRKYRNNTSEKYAYK